MAKPKTPNQKRKYSELNTRLARYVALIESIYEDLNLEAAKLVGNNTDYNADSGKPFRWSDYPQTRKKIADIQKQFVEDIQAVIYRGTSEEWKNSNEVQDLLANAVLRAYDAQVDGEEYRIYYQENSDALKSFQERKDKGMNVSDKLWQQSTIYKQGLEDAISCAIQKGTSAVTLSKQISKYLQDFPQLQKDYKERFGKASRAKDCEYRSIRLARSEINMSYRQAENQRWSQMDFVVGYEIKLSGSHHVDDICDQLKGKYPKTFVWTGWHPNDMCYKIPILKTEEEFWAWDGRGEATTESVNEVKDVPDGFKKWVLDNRSRIDEAKKRGTLPYFLKDNPKYSKQKKSIAEIAKERHANRDEVAIRQAARNRELLEYEDVGAGEIAVLRKNASIYNVDISEFNDYIYSHKFEESFGLITDKERQKLESIYAKYERMTNEKKEAYSRRLKSVSDIISSHYSYGGFAKTSRDELMKIIPSRTMSYDDCIAKLEEFKKRLNKSYRDFASSPMKLTAKYQDFDSFDWDNATTTLEKYEAANSMLANLYGSTFMDSNLYKRMIAAVGNRTELYKAVDIFTKEYDDNMLKDVMESINHLTEIRNGDLGDIYKPWVSRFNDYMATINGYDIANKGYAGIYREIEGAYNILKLSTDKVLKEYGLDKLSFNTPYRLVELFRENGINPIAYLAKKEFYDVFDIFVPLVSKVGKTEAYFSPTYSHVRIDMTDRLRKSEWYRSSLQYHEYGHAFDYTQGQWRNSSHWNSLYDEFAEIINKDAVTCYNGSIEYGSSIKTKYWEVSSRIDIDDDIEEMLGTVSDNIQSLDKTHSWFGYRGHPVDYYNKGKEQCLAEFIAHASENYWAGNKYFQEIMPELHKKMLSLYQRTFEQYRNKKK